MLCKISVFCIMLFLDMNCYRMHMHYIKTRIIQSVRGWLTHISQVKFRHSCVILYISRHKNMTVNWWCLHLISFSDVNKTFTSIAKLEYFFLQCFNLHGHCSSDPPVSFANISDRHDITEILFTVTLNTIRKQRSKHNWRPLNIQVMLISDCKMKVVKYWIFGLKHI